MPLTSLPAPVRPAPGAPLPGTVLRARSGFYTVRLDDGTQLMAGQAALNTRRGKELIRSSYRGLETWKDGHGIVVEVQRTHGGKHQRHQRQTLPSHRC